MAIACFVGQPFSAAAESPSRAAVVDEWLRQQTKLVTWSAELTQTRTLKTLVQPLVTTGRVWFAAPNLFRWELGDPPQTIAVRQPERLLVIYPRLRRVEQYAFSASRHGPWRDALALLEAGFPRNRHELEARFRWVESVETGGVACPGS